LHLLKGSMQAAAASVTAGQIRRGHEVVRGAEIREIEIRAETVERLLQNCTRLGGAFGLAEQTHPGSPMNAIGAWLARRTFTCMLWPWRSRPRFPAR
jgi:hypothetical protein